MMRTTGRAALANLKIWWPELLWVTLGGALTLTVPGPKIPDCLIVFAFSGIFWAMGYRHRNRPIWEVIRHMDAKLDAALDRGRGEEKPPAKVRHLRGV